MMRLMQYVLVYQQRCTINLQNKHSTFTLDSENSKVLTHIPSTGQTSGKSRAYHTTNYNPHIQITQWCTRWLCPSAFLPCPLPMPFAQVKDDRRRTVTSWLIQSNKRECGAIFRRHFLYGNHHCPTVIRKICWYASHSLSFRGNMQRVPCRPYNR